MTLQKRDALSKAEEKRLLMEKEKEIMKLMDDDARRSKPPQLDEPEPSETKAADDKIAANLG